MPDGVPVANGAKSGGGKYEIVPELNQEFSCLIPLEQDLEYKKIQKEAVRRHKHGLSYVKIAKLLGVTDKTVKKAIERS